MTDEFTPDRRRQVETWLGRELEAHELDTVRSLADLSTSQRAVVDAIAPRHRLACMIYLRGVVDGLHTKDAFDFIDTIRGPHM